MSLKLTGSNIRKIKRGNREISIRSKSDEIKEISESPLSKQILVQENDYCESRHSIVGRCLTPSDILAIKGPTKVQEYIVNEIQEVLPGFRCEN
jgi:DNA-directed RNA polymerase subunit beta'